MSVADPNAASHLGGGPPEIRPEEVQLEELIGSGSFGKVYKGKCRHKAVAVKILHKQQFDPATLAAFRKEVHLMSQVYHPNVCLFMGACTIPGKCMIITELVPKLNLEVMLRDESIQLPLTLRMRMARDAALGVNWLHESNPVIIHRDLKTSNLLVDENLRVKICDFGLSALKPRNKMIKDQTSAKGTPLYMAPEVMMFKEFNESSDVYSFGIVLWEILVRREPFSNYRQLDKFREAVCVRHERPPIPADCLESLRTLIERCWDKDPARRPTFREIILQLDIIIIETAIADRRGREFWKKYFLTDYTVAWGTFVDALCDWLHVPNRAQSENNTIDHLNIKCLKAILAEPPKEQGGERTESMIVSLEKFGRILAYFGPLQPPAAVMPAVGPPVAVAGAGAGAGAVAGLGAAAGPGEHPMFPRDPTIMDRIRELMQQKWFHGDLSTPDASSMLSGHPHGTFLVRFSSTSPGTYTLSQVVAAPDGDTIRHQRIQYMPGQGFLFQGEAFMSLQDLVMRYTVRPGWPTTAEDMVLDPNLACPNYKFMSLFFNASAPLNGYSVPPSRQ